MFSFACTRCEIILDLQNFIKLNNQDRIMAALAGTFITEHQDGSRFTLLYHLEDFFVEIKFNVETNEVRPVRPFNSSFLLEPYLADVDLSILLT